MHPMRSYPEHHKQAVSPFLGQVSLVSLYARQMLKKSILNEYDIL